MFKPKKQVWRDNTEPPKNYIWERLNESGSYIGTFEYNGERWVKIKDSKPSGDEGTCTCGDKFVLITDEAKILYGTDEAGNAKFVLYSENPISSTVVTRTSDGRIKSVDAKEENDVVTYKDICWNE